MPTRMQMRALVAWRIEEKTQQQIAGEFGVSQPAIAMRVRRWKHKLASQGLSLPKTPRGRRRRVKVAQLSVTADLSET